jgi:hypothetical protein
VCQCACVRANGFSSVHVQFQHCIPGGGGGGEAFDLCVPIPCGEIDNEETAADLSNEADTPR